MKQLLSLLLVTSFLLSACSPQKEGKTTDPNVPLPITEAISAGVLLSETKTEAEPFPDPPSPVLSYEISGIEPIDQAPEFPTGCEACAAVTALRFFKEAITVGEFVDKHLKKNNDFELRDGLLYGPDPYSVFVGDPRNPTSFGCMAPVIEDALKGAAGDRFEVLNRTGTELSTLCEEYVVKNVPILLWVTSDMLELEEGISWFLPSGELFTWPAREHCMVLIGFDEENYVLLDSEKNGKVLFPKDLVQARYQELGMQALAVVPKT